MMRPDRLRATGFVKIALIGIPTIYGVSVLWLAGFSLATLSSMRGVTWAVASWLVIGSIGLLSVVLAWLEKRERPSPPGVAQV